MRYSMRSHCLDRLDLSSGASEIFNTDGDVCQQMSKKLARLPRALAPISSRYDKNVCPGYLLVCVASARSSS